MWVHSLHRDGESVPTQVDDLAPLGGWTVHGYWVGAIHEPEAGPPDLVVRCTSECWWCRDGEDHIRAACGLPPRPITPTERQANPGARAVADRPRPSGRPIPRGDRQAAVETLVDSVLHHYAIACGQTEEQQDPLLADILTLVLRDSESIERAERRFLRDEVRAMTRDASPDARAALVKVCQMIQERGVTFRPGYDRDPYE
ncbi:hypothetical protein [Allonocardiopsis opalescens]|nr:hypothetical protein [Allonocardiopsis opalescens]